MNTPNLDNINNRAATGFSSIGSISTSTVIVTLSARQKENSTAYRISRLCFPARTIPD